MPHQSSFFIADLQALLSAQVAIIIERHDRYMMPSFERSKSNMLDAFTDLDVLLLEPPPEFAVKLICSSDKWAVFRIRVHQLQRLHSAKSERLAAEINATRSRTLRNTRLFTGGMLTVGIIIIIRMTQLIRAGLEQQKVTADALRDSRERTQAILDNAAEAIITIDEKGRIEAFNTAAERTFGYAASEVLNQNISILMPEPHRAEHDGFIKEYLATGIKHVIGTTRETEACRKDGSIFPIELSISEVLLAGRRIFTGIVLDISERRSLEEQVRQSQKMDAVGRLAGGIAHDFNNILTVIQGYASVLRAEDGLSESARGDLSKIELAAGRAQALTKQLLVVSRKQILQPKLINLNQVINDSQTMFARVIGEHIQLETKLDPGLRLTKADPSQIEQIIVNLILNARDAMPDGGTLTIQTANWESNTLHRHAQNVITPGAYCVLAVHDTGLGIDSKIQERVFEPFFTTKEPGKGTGLGLSTVYGIVQQSGGHVWFKTRPNRGTSFKVYFHQIDDNEISTAPAQRSLLEHSLHGDETVLVVEDEESVRKLVLRVLAGYGYQTIEAASPKEAIAIFNDRMDEIDIVVTDIVMPGMSGRKMVDILDQVCPNLRVLFMSGYTDEEIDRRGALEEGIHFIQKPFMPTQFIESLRRVLDGAVHRAVPVRDSQTN